MAVDVHDFSIPESDFSGLHRAANTLERRNERNELYRRQEAARKNANATFLLNYLDPKDHLTGTNYDPQIVSGFQDLLAQGSKLANEGADANMIMMALSPKVSKLSQYAETAKGINARIKDQLSKIPDKAGYDKVKLDELARKTAFYNPDGTMKDITTIDPNVDYITETIHQRPDEVTNDAAIDEFVKNSPKFTNTQRVKRTNSKGGYELKKSKVTAPSWATVDDNGEIVPRFDVATNEGQPHTFDFKSGEQTKTAPIRLMNEKDFDALMGSNPGIADWVKGQVMKADRNIDLNTIQAKNAARAIMYDELKRRGGGGIEDIEETKANPIHITNKYGGNAKGELTINDVYADIDNAMSQWDAQGSSAFMPFQNLSQDAKDVLIPKLQQNAKALEDGAVNTEDLRLIRGNDKVMRIFTKDGEYIMDIGKKNVNLKAQPSVLEKRNVLKEGNGNQSNKQKGELD